MKRAGDKHSIRVRRAVYFSWQALNDGARPLGIIQKTGGASGRSSSSEQRDVRLLTILLRSCLSLVLSLLLLPARTRERRESTRTRFEAPFSQRQPTRRRGRGALYANTRASRFIVWRDATESATGTMTMMAGKTLAPGDAFTGRRTGRKTKITLPARRGPKAERDEKTFPLFSGPRIPGERLVYDRLSSSPARL